MNPDFADSAWLGYTCDPLEKVKGLTFIGKLKTKTSKEIQSSPVSIGMETLDRDTYDPNDIYELIGECGAKWARLQTGWIKCESVPGRYNFAWLDSLVDNLLNLGIQPWFSVSYGNPLYTPNPELQEFEEANPGQLPPGHLRGCVGEVPLYHGENAITAWKNYVYALTCHFKDRIQYYEIWNEPELSHFWRFQGKSPYPELQEIERMQKCGQDYTELVRITAAEIRNVQPSAKIVSCHQQQGSEFTYSAAASGLSELVDVVCTHRYSTFNPAEDRRIFDQLKSIMNAKEMWMGEGGAPAKVCATMPYMAGATEYSQAKSIARRLVYDISYGFNISSIYTICDFKSYWHDGSDSTAGLIYRQEKRPKLAYYAYQSVATLFDGVKKVDDIAAHVRPPYGNRSCSAAPYAMIQTGVFRTRDGIPLYSFFQAEREVISPDSVSVEIICAQPNSEKFKKPVIVDTVRQSVYRIENVETPFWSMGRDVITLPIPDYPLFLTEESVVGIV